MPCHGQSPLGPFRLLEFDDVLASFRQSEMGQSFIKPWRRDFEGSRDSLIAKMEKAPELEPWVNRYTHCREDESIIWQLFCDKYGFVRNEEEALNTDNWIRLLTIAAVLQEYDEQHAAVTADVLQEYEEQQDATAATADKSDEDETILTKLSLYFKDDASALRFLKSVKDMNDKEIITLVKKYRDAKLCTDTSKALWRVLYDAGLYTAKYSNWNGMMRL